MSTNGLADTHDSMARLVAEPHWHLAHASSIEYTTLSQVQPSIPVGRKYHVFGSVNGPTIRYETIIQPQPLSALASEGILTFAGSDTWSVEVSCDGKARALPPGVGHLRAYESVCNWG